jgi:hypothetical protein
MLLLYLSIVPLSGGMGQLAFGRKLDCHSSLVGYWWMTINLGLQVGKVRKLEMDQEWK